MILKSLISWIFPVKYEKMSPCRRIINDRLLLNIINHENVELTQLKYLQLDYYYLSINKCFTEDLWSRKVHSFEELQNINQLRISLSI